MEKLNRGGLGKSIRRLVTAGSNAKAEEQADIPQDVGVVPEFLGEGGGCAHGEKNQNAKSSLVDIIENRA